MSSGVYLITNKVNSKRYPGSAVNVERRWGEHKRYLKKGKHHSEHLQRAWLKYGEGSFEFLIIEECPEDELLIREQVHLDAVRIRNPDGTLGEIDHNLAYNACPIAGSRLGSNCSEKTKKKMSEVQSGEKNSMYGKHHSEETKKKISEANSGEKGHNFGRTGEKSVWFGKHHSEESKKKMSGEKHSGAILTWDKVREIRKRYAAGGITQKQLAVEYDVSCGCIQGIVDNHNWKEIG